MRRGLRDGLIKSTIDELNAPFKQLYLDNWVFIPYFKWMIKGGKEPQVIDYLRRIIVKKVISDVVKIETNNKIKEKYNKDITNKMWQDCFVYLNLTSIGNPLQLSPTTKDEFDEAHFTIARSLNSCIIVTGDKIFIQKHPDIVWYYGKVRQIHSDT